MTLLYECVYKPKHCLRIHSRQFLRCFFPTGSTSWMVNPNWGGYDPRKPNWGWFKWALPYVLPHESSQNIPRYPKISLVTMMNPGKIVKLGYFDIGQEFPSLLFLIPRKNPTSLVQLLAQGQQRHGPMWVAAAVTVASGPKWGRYSWSSLGERVHRKSAFHLTTWSLARDPRVFIRSHPGRELIWLVVDPMLSGWWLMMVNDC